MNGSNGQGPVRVMMIPEPLLHRVREILGSITGTAPPRTVAEIGTLINSLHELPEAAGGGGDESPNGGETE